ncbi:hypothetical protein OAO85_00205 [Candidatus Pelagibacter sp.]|nr:hypothetical protein [Candidatus Pelagibacter sp.]
MNSDQDLRAKFTLAEKLFLEKKTQESINLYREILSINPNIIPAINNLGHTDKTSDEAIYGPLVHAILSGILCYGLADKIYI